MPNDVGVLQLSIEDNSKQAAGGLQELGKALSSVKTALSGGLNLPTQSVKNFAAAVASNSKALSSTGTFLNAVKEYQKAFKDVGKVKIDTTPITELQGVLKEGIKIGQAGTQLTKLREAFTGDWSQVGDAGDEIHSAVSGMKAIKDMGDEFKSSGTAQNIKEVADAINALSKAQNDMPSGGAHDLYGMFGGAQATEAGQNVGRGLAQGAGGERDEIINIIREIAQEMIDAAKEKLDEHSPSKVFEDIGRNAMLGLKNGIFATQGEVQAASAEVAEQLSKQFYTQIKPTDMMGSPLEYLTDIFRQTNTSLNDYASGINAVLPKVQSMSSEEMVMAGNAKRATAEISNLINQLNSFSGPKGQALQGIIDVITGVSRGNAGGGMINASSTMFTPVKEMTESFSAIREATEGTIQIFDSASGAYNEMHVNCANIAESAEKATESVQQMNQSITEGIALADMPASGKNGVFANANEEFLYLTGQIEKARAETQQFFDIAMKAENQLKHGGPRSKEDLQFDYQHGIEGYERAIAAEEKYQDSLRGLMTYVQQTASEMRSAVTDTHEAPIEQAAAQVSEAMDRIGSSRGIVAAREEMQSFGIASGEATSKIELLRNRVEELKRSYSEISKMPAALFGGSDGKASALNNVALKIGRVNEQIEKLVQNAHKAQDAANLKQLQESITVPQHDNMQFVENMMNQYSEIDLLTIKMEGMKQALADDITQNRVDTQQIAQRTIAIQQLRDKIEELKNVQGETTKETSKSISAWKMLGTSLKTMFPTLSNLIKRFKSMIIMRSIRYLVRQLAAGMSEGIQNVYQYSKAIGGSFAPAMDEAATALQQMKNSIGAALAPAIQALIPILQTVVNWFINLVNYVNQFFALLNGQKTWTRALPATASAFDKQTKAAKGAGAAMKDLLADWDELNIIQSQSGGGSGAGSGTKAEDYLKMFEEVGKFDNKVKDITDFVKQNFKDILIDVGLIGAGMKLWKLSKSVTDNIPFLSKLAGWATVGATIAVTLKLTDMLGQEYVSTGDPGWLIADALTGGVGATIAGSIASILAGTKTGVATAGFTLVLSGLIDVKNALSAAQQEQKGRAWGLNAIGSIKTGIGAGLILGGLGAGTVGALAGGVMAAGITFLITTAFILDDKPKAIKWGSYRATASEIRAFVEDTVFVVSPNTILNIIDPVIEVKNEKQAELQTTVDEVKLSVKKLSLGIDVDNTLEDLKEQVFGNSETGTTGLIGQFKETARAMNNVIETGITLVPTTGTAEDGSAKDIIDKTGEGWKLLTSHMDDLGKDLAEHLAKAYEEGIDEKAKEMELRSVTELSEMMASVSAAITQGQEREALVRGLEQNIENLSPESWGELFTYIEEYKKQVEAAYTKAYDEVTDTLAGEQSGLRQAMENELERSGGKETTAYKQYEAEYKYITDLLENRRKGRKDAIERASNAAMDENVVERIRQILIGNINYDAMQAINIQEAFNNMGINLNNTGALEQFLDGFFNADGTVNEIAKHKYDIFMDGLLQSVYGESYDNVKKAVDAGLLTYEDLLPSETIKALTQSFLLNKDNSDVQDALSKFVGGQFKISEGNREITDHAKTAADIIKEEYYGALERGILENSYEMDQILGSLYGRFGDEVEKVLELDIPVNVTPDVTVDVDTNVIDEDLKKAVEEALKDNVITVDERNMLDFQFGANEVEKAIQQLHGNGMAKLTPVRLSASAGFNYSDSGYGNRSENEPILTEPKDPQAETANVAAGVQKGNVDVVNAIQTIIPILTQILQKESTVVVAPGSDWGRHNAKSNSAWNKMTGMVAMEE